MDIGLEPGTQQGQTAVLTHIQDPRFAEFPPIYRFTGNADLHATSCVKGFSELLPHQDSGAPTSPQARPASFDDSQYLSSLTSI